MVAVPERHPAWAATVREVAATSTRIGQNSWAVCLALPFTPCKGNTIHFAINAGNKPFQRLSIADTPKTFNSQITNFKKCFKTSNEDGSLGACRGCTFSPLNFTTINSFKMKNNLFYSLLVVCLFSLFSCQQTPEAPAATATVETPAPPDMAAIKAEIQALESAYAVAHTAGDAAAVTAFYSDDAVTMGDDMTAVSGKAAILKDFEDSYAKRKKKRTMSFEVLEVFGDENRVTEIGKSTGKDETGKVVYTGKYMAIWEKRNGKWLTIRDISNDDKKEE
jgi:ketosteroid isomerase-like protein